MSIPRVTIVGSANMDLVVTAPRLPGPGETVLGDNLTSVAGGKGANQAIAAARAGAECTFIGAVGTDAFGGELRAVLVEAGIDDSLVRTMVGPSGVGLIVVDDEGENAIVVAPGANATLTGLDEAGQAAVAGADVLLCQLETPIEGVRAAIEAAAGSGTYVILNAAPATDLPEDFYAGVDLLVANQHEASALVNHTVGSIDNALEPSEADSADLAALVDDLLMVVPRVVITRGSASCWYGDRDGAMYFVSPPTVQAVDTTAAGDAFTGALAVARAEGRTVVDALRWASAAGAASTRILGASLGLPTRKEIDELYDATYGQARPGAFGE
jgi:ribokinase